MNFNLSPNTPDWPQDLYAQHSWEQETLKLRT